MRTFAPIVAGIVQMDKKKFSFFNIVGSVTWVLSMLIAGHFLQKWILQKFILDFVSVMPNTPKSKVKSRIIFTPTHAKRLLRALTENIQRYEATHGTVKEIEQIEIPMNFGGPAAQA